MVALGANTTEGEITEPLQVYELAPLAVKLAFVAEHTVALGGLIVNIGKVLVVTPNVTVETQPEALVPDKV